jgi:hypothetical protein
MQGTHQLQHTEPDAFGLFLDDPVFIDYLIIPV